MGSDEIYSTEDIIKVAGEVVQAILKEPMAGEIASHDYGGFYHKGPLSWFGYYSKRFNPKGKFAIDIEALTTKQKGIVIELVGEAIPKFGKKAADNKLNIPGELLVQLNKKRDFNRGFSSGEWREMQERAMVDTIIRTINSK
jgi:hypothetical protein